MTLYGIDISGYQFGIDLSVVPCDFVAVYISGGTTSGNADGRRQVQQAIAERKRLIVYHFEGDGSPGTAAQEAEWFLTMLDHVGPVPPGTLYVLDNETSNALNVPWQREWLDTIRAARGGGVGMYAPYTNLITGAYQSLRDAGYWIWESAYVAGYQRIDGYNPPAGRAPIPGGDPAIWQFTSSGYLPGWGGPLDLNVALTDWGTLTPDSSNVTPLGGFLMALTDQQQQDLYDRVMGGIPAGSAVGRTNSDGTPARLLDTADGATLRGDIAAGTQRAVAETSAAYHQSLAIQAGQIAALTAAINSIAAGGVDLAKVTEAAQAGVKQAFIDLGKAIDTPTAATP